VDLLTPYKETAFHGCNFEQPLPDLIDGEEEYEVERILDLRRFGRGRQVQYLIHWKGYPTSDDQWIPWSDLNAPDLIVEFQKENPDAVTHIRAAQVDKDFLVPSTLPPTSLPPHLLHIALMSHGSPTLPQSPVQSRGRALSLYETASAEVGDDTNGSTLIRRIVAITQAAADGDAAEAHEREEANITRSQGDDTADEAAGSIEGGTVLAGVSTQSSVYNAPTIVAGGQTLRPLLIPTEAYPPSGSATSPIDVD